MKKSLQGLLVLINLNQYRGSGCIPMLLGVAAAQGSLDWRFITILISNWLAVGFGFMVANIENAPEDALLDSHHHQNPIASGLISLKSARIATFITAILSIGLYSLLGGWSLLFGLLTLAVGWLYAYRNLRLNTIPVLNILTYSLMLAGLPFLCGYASFTPNLSKGWLWPFIFVISFAIIRKYIKESRSFSTEIENQPQKSTPTLDSRASVLILLASLLSGLISGVYTFIVMELLPIWVLILIFTLTAVLMLSRASPLWRPQKPAGTLIFFQKALEMATVIALLLQFITPWLNQFITWKIFL